MSYLNRQQEVFERLRKMKTITWVGVVVWFGGLFALSYFSISIYIGAGYSILILLAVWYLLRQLNLLLCNSCGYDLEGIVDSLGKDAETGYCPKCGSQIE